MYNRLKELGVPVSITRDKDITLTRNERINNMLTPFGNSKDVIIASNHINAGGGEGAEVVYSLRNNSTLADSILNEIGNKGQLKRKVYQRRLPENITKDYYYIMRLTENTEPVLIEYGFIDNEKDLNKLNNNLLDYVEGAVKALTEYSGYIYTPRKNIENIYIVQKGDTLYSIARKTNTNINDLIKNNNLKNNTIYLGQKLYLDKPIEENNYYIVKKGDSLYKIAQNNNLTVKELIDLNNLTSNTIMIGQKLKIKPNNKTYTVVKGDTLYSISKTNNIDLNTLKEINNLNNNIIYEGLELKLDRNNKYNKYNKVFNKESIYSITPKYNVPVNSLNKINNNIVPINDNLIIN